MYRAPLIAGLLSWPLFPWLETGDKAPEFTLARAGGGTVTSAEALGDGPALMIFLRYLG